MNPNKKYVLILDTETANTLVDENGKLVMNYVLPYDLGLSVVALSDFQSVEQHSLVIREIYLGERDLMQSAYYAHKLPKYHEALMNGKRRMVNAMDAYYLVRDICKRYNIVAICAHNARFDVQALNNLVRWVTKSNVRYFLPYGVEIWDSMRAFQRLISNRPSYRAFCERNGYMTASNRVRLTAEVCYRYVTNNHDFVEEHQGLDDVLIETEILHFVHRQHKKVDYRLYVR